MQINRDGRLVALSLNYYPNKKFKSMKAKFLFSLFAAVLVTQALMAQFHIGIKAGANITKVDGKSFKDQFNYGYHAGGFAEIGIGKKFAIQPEVLFSQFTTTLDSSYNHVYSLWVSPRAPLITLWPMWKSDSNSAVASAISNRFSSSWPT
jgi:hypothetical protein